MTEPNVTLADFIAQLKQTIARGGREGEILESLKKILDVKYTLVQANYVEGEEKTMMDYDKYSILGNIASGDSAENALRYIIDSFELIGVTDENRAIFDSLSALLVKKMNERRWIKAVFNGDDFGERLSQYAALLSTSAKLKIKPVLDPALWPPLRISDNEVHTDEYMTQLFGDLPHVSIAMMNSYPTIKTQQPPENFRKFGEISLADQHIFNIILAGKYQAQGYWRDGGQIEVAIRKRFTPSSTYLDEIKRLRSLTSTSAFLFEGYDECAKETFVKLNPSATFINISKTTSPLEQLAIAIQCPLGGVCNETMTAWWGAMLNTSPNKLVFSPHHDIDLVKGCEFMTSSVEVFPSVPIKTFVVNLDTRPDRMTRFNTRLDYSNAKSILNVTRFSAYHGVDYIQNKWTPELEHLFRYDPSYPKTNPYRNHNKTPGEIGCALSHYNLWKVIAEANEQLVLVLEDDVVFGPNFCERFNNLKSKLLQATTQFDVCFLGTHDDVDKYNDNALLLCGEENDYNSQTIVKQFNPNPPTPRINGGGTYGYLITKRGALNLLECATKFGIPQAIDWFMFEMMKMNVSLKCQPHIVFSPLYGTETLDSDIQNMQNVAPSFINIDNFFSPPSRKKIDVFPTGNWADSQTIINEWKKLGFNSIQNWGKIELKSDPRSEITCLINFPHSTAAMPETKNTIVYHMEPSCLYKNWGALSKPSREKFLDVQTHEYTHNNLEWHISASFDDLCNERVDLTKKQSSSGSEISTVLSKQYVMPGHKLRIDFVKFLRSKGFNIDTFGSCEECIPGRHGGVLPRHQKDKALYSYKYTFNAENVSERNFFTEKMVDGILSECLTFYWGCPNISDYIPKEAFIELPLDDFEMSYQIIQDTIRNDEWSKRIGFIREAKAKILTELSFFPTLDSILVRKNKYSNDDEIKSLVIEARNFRERNDFDNAFNTILKAICLYSESTSDVIKYERYHILGIVGWYANKKIMGRWGAKKALENKGETIDRKNYEFYCL